MKTINRRNFLKYSALASTSLMIPSFLSGFEKKGNLFAKTSNQKVLVVVQLSGGNDGLNTIVPYRNDIYYGSRSKIAIDKNKILTLEKDLGMNPQLDKLKSLYDNGNLTIINNVGYPNPDRSHFRSMDIWHTASDSNEYLQTGWVGRYLDSNCEHCEKPYNAIEVNDTLSLAMKGELRNGIAMQDPKRFFMSSSDKYFTDLADAYNRNNSGTDTNKDYLYKTMIETTSSAEYVYESSKIYKSKVDYPNGAFAKNLKTIAELIVSNIDTSVFYISLTGFDTHINQAGTQNRLLKEFSDGVYSFSEDLKINNRFNDVLLMTFSEFGRRVKQNASNGTDHGTANNLFLLNGNPGNPGVFNDSPNLNDLDNGDLKYEVDFRNVYATILKKWLNVDDNQILGKEFDDLNVI